MWAAYELLTNWGSRAYPVACTFDAQGRRKTMITWKNFATRTGAATTTWNYDTNRGFLISKVYDDGRGTTNAYTPAGRLRTRTWARGITTTYQTNAAGEVVGLAYSDGTTSNVTYNLDRLGRRTNIIDSAGNRLLTYTDTGQILMETNAIGTLAGFSLTNGYDALLRRTTLTLRSNTTALLTHAYAYDGASRLTNVSDGTYSAAYSFLANSPLVSQITFRSNSTTRMTTSKQHDFLNRLLVISNLPSADTAIAYSYAYNDANQRTRCTMPDGSYWLYEYDALGQLVSGKHYWGDDTPVAGQEFEYAFDDIGNRTTTKAGGDQNGVGLHTATYTANSLNQYSQRDVPGFADILGIAHAQAVVSVNGDTNLARHGEYFWKDLSINNASAAVWQSVTNRAVLTNATNTLIGNLLLPKTPETFAHDADGNLTNDGRWMLTWDAENRLVKMESYSSAPTASKRRINYTYDSQSRLVRHKVEDGSSGSYVLTNDEKLVWNDWLCLADVNGTNNALERRYLWGLDLSGSLQGAGGIGGLLAIGDSTSGITGFAAYDGNGNLTALASGTDGAVSARYEYDPFGRTLRATGPMATTNPIRFSSKRTDDTADVAYYGYRFYSPTAGRWLSRDPFEEFGGRGLNVYCRNHPADLVDPYALDPLGDSVIDGPKKILVLDKTYPATQLTTYAYKGSGTPCWWETSGKVKIPPGAYPTGESTAIDDSSVAVQVGLKKYTKTVTVVRPKFVNRILDPQTDPNFVYNKVPLVDLYQMRISFQLSVTDQFRSALVGVGVSETISFTNSASFISLFPVITGTATTQPGGVFWDTYIARFTRITGFVDVRQVLTIGNWEATLQTEMKGDGTWSGTEEAGFQ